MRFSFLVLGLALLGACSIERIDPNDSAAVAGAITRSEAGLVIGPRVSSPPIGIVGGEGTYYLAETSSGGVTLHGVICCNRGTVKWLRLDGKPHEYTQRTDRQVIPMTQVAGGVTIVTSQPLNTLFIDVPLSRAEVQRAAARGLIVNYRDANGIRQIAVAAPYARAFQEALR